MTNGITAQDRLRDITKELESFRSEWSNAAEQVEKLKKEISLERAKKLNDEKFRTELKLAFGTKEEREEHIEFLIDKESRGIVTKLAEAKGMLEKHERNFQSLDTQRSNLQSIIKSHKG